MTADAFAGTKQTGTATAVQSTRREWSAVQGVAVFLVFLLISIIPLLTHPLPPLEDYANHVSRMYVIADAGRNPYLAKFYEIEWDMIPNLMMDLIVPHIARYVNVYLASQLFTIAIFMLIMSGTFAMNRALFKRWSVLPLIAFPLLYNYVFLIGVMNYFFGIGLALWGLAAWITFRERAWPLRYVVSALFGIALFFCHLFSLGVYGLGLMAFEIWFAIGVERASWPVRILRFVCAGIPFMLLIPILLSSPTWVNAKDWSWESLGKIDGLIYAVETYSDIVAFVLTATVVVAGAWAARHKMLRVHPFLMVLLIVGGLVYMPMPRVLFGSYLADQRLPIAIMFMVVACFRVELRQEFVRRLFLLGAMGLLGARVAEVDIAWANSSPSTVEMKESFRKIQKGSKILVAYTDSNMPNEVEHLGLVHAATLAILERSALITTAFTVKGKQVMHVRPRIPQAGRHRRWCAANHRPARARCGRPQSRRFRLLARLGQQIRLCLLAVHRRGQRQSDAGQTEDRLRGRQLPAVPRDPSRHGPERAEPAEAGQARQAVAGRRPTSACRGVADACRRIADACRRVADARRRVADARRRVASAGACLSAAGACSAAKTLTRRGRKPP